MVVRLTLVPLLILTSLASCTHTPNQSATGYQSMWLKINPNTIQTQSDITSLKGAFDQCAVSTELLDAEQCWAYFLSQWTPENSSFEDAMHATLVQWAQHEQQRITSIKQQNHSARKETETRLYQLSGH